MKITRMLKEYKFIFYGYFTLWILFLLTFFISDSNKIAVIINHILGNGFYSSLKASCLEDLIFFGIIGLATVIYSARKPDEEYIYTRINYIANRHSISPDAKKFLEKHILEALSYNRQSKIMIRIRDFRQYESTGTPELTKRISNFTSTSDNVANMLKLHIEIDNVIVNMCKDVDFSLNNIIASIQPSRIVEGEAGQVTLLSITNKQSNEQGLPIVIGDPIKIVSMKGYSQTFDYSIPKDSDVVWRFYWDIWVEIGNNKNVENDWFHLYVSRFTENLHIDIVNEIQDIGMVLPIDYKFSNIYNTVDCSNKQLSNGIVENLCDKVKFLSKDRFWIFFNKPYFIKGA
jgi:hypothetical protein